jgi:hypothetical protein
MGQVVKQDLAISMRVMLALLADLEQEWTLAGEFKRQDLAYIGAFSCIAYGGSFRGNEVLLVDLFGLNKYSRLKLEEGGGGGAL